MNKLVALFLVLCMVCGMVSIGAAEGYSFDTSLCSMYVDEAFIVQYKEDLDNNGVPYVTGKGYNEKEDANLYFYVFLYSDEINETIRKNADIEDQLLANHSALLDLIDISFLEELPLSFALNEDRVAEYVVAKMSSDSRTTWTGSHYLSESGLGCWVMIDSPDYAKSFYTMLDILESIRPSSEEKLAALRNTTTEGSGENAAENASQKYVIITNSSANIRSGPGGDYAKIITAKQGDTFPLISEDGNWYIISVNGQTGYVTKSLSAIQE